MNIEWMLIGFWHEIEKIPECWQGASGLSISDLVKPPENQLDN
jgi:hypothetical protein